MTEDIMLRMGLDAKQVEREITGLKMRLDSFAKWLSSAFAVGFLWGGFNRILDMVERIQQTAKSWGVSTSFYQDITNIGKAAGIAEDKLGAAINRWVKSLPVGSDIEKSFYAIADAIEAIPDPAERARVAMEKFGKSGVELLPLFAGGAAGIREMAKEFQKFSDKTLKDLAEADALMDKLKNDVWIVAGKTTGGVWKSITEFFDYAKFMAKNPSWLKDIPGSSWVWAAEREKERNATALLRRPPGTGANQSVVNALAIKDYQEFLDKLTLTSSASDPIDKLRVLGRHLKEATNELSKVKTLPEYFDKLKKVNSIQQDIREVQESWDKSLDTALDKIKNNQKQRAAKQKQYQEEYDRASKRLADSQDAVRKGYMGPATFSVEELAQSGFNTQQAVAARWVVQLREWAKWNAMAGNTGLADRQLGIADNIFGRITRNNKFLVDPMAELLKTNRDARDELQKISKAATVDGFLVRNGE